MAWIVAFEGGEGAGKTTQAKILYGRLCQSGWSTRILREPGGTPLGEELRRLITAPRDVLWTLGRFRNQNLPFPASGRSQLVARDLWPPLTPEAELLLFMASRVQLVKDVIIPSLQKDVVLICDRFIHSTVAYQGYGRGMDLELIDKLNTLCTQGIKSHLVVFLDVEVEIGLKRKSRVGEISRFEEEDPSFHKKVREGYKTLFEQEGNRWVKIDAKLPKKEISKRIFDSVMQLLPRRELPKAIKASGCSSYQTQFSGGRNNLSLL